MQDASRQHAWTWLCGAYHLSHLLIVAHARVSDKEHVHVVPVARAGEGLERRAVLPPVVDDAAKALPVALDLNRTQQLESASTQANQSPHGWTVRQGALLPSRTSCQLRQPLHPYSMKVAKGCLVSLPPLM